MATRIAPAATALLAAVLLAAAPAVATEFREVAASPAVDGAPSWSPDGQRIAFSSLMNGEWEVFIVGAWGGPIENFSEHPDIDIYPAWSPTDEWIAYSSTRDNGSGDRDMDIWIQSVEGSEQRCLTDWPGYDSLAGWAPGGDRIAFSSDRSGPVEIWVLDVADPTSPRRVCGGPAECSAPAFSPDGQWIAFYGHAEGDPVHWRLFKAPAAGGEVEEIQTGLPVATEPSWSPGGRYLAFCGGADPLNWDLYLWDFSQGKSLQLTSTRYPEQSAVWNRAGTEIVYASLVAGNKDIWVAYDLPVSSPAVETPWGSLKRRFSP